MKLLFKTNNCCWGMVVRSRRSLDTLASGKSNAKAYFRPNTEHAFQRDVEDGCTYPAGLDQCPVDIPEQDPADHWATVPVAAGTEERPLSPYPLLRD